MLNFAKIINICKHEKVEHNHKESYCPDCGAFVEIKYYIVRCACCHIKRKGTLFASRVLPIDLFCRNCGSNEFYLEEIDIPNAFNLEYVVIKKETRIIHNERKTTCQIWVEDTPKLKPKLLTDNLVPST